MSANFTFGSKVRKRDGQEIFVVLGVEPNGKIQIARFNHKTSAKPGELARA